MPRQLNDVLESLNNELPSEAIEKADGQDYLPGWYVIETANDVFGPLGWSYEVTDINFVGQGKTNSGTPWELWAARVRVTVFVDRDDGQHAVTRHDTAGAVMYGDEASTEAGKAAVTTALKRCFRTFGERFGNLLYSEDYRQKKQRQKRSARNSGGSGRSRSNDSYSDAAYQRQSKPRSGEHMSAKAEQLDAIKRLAREASGKDHVPESAIVASINRRAPDIFGDHFELDSLDELTFKQAKQIIQFLQ